MKGDFVGPRAENINIRGLIITTVLAVLLLTGAAAAESTKSDESTWIIDDQPWKLAVLAGGNFGITFGDYYRGTSRAFGYDFSLIVPLSHKFSLQGSASKVGITVNTDPTVIGSGTSTDYIYRYYDVSATRIMISLQRSGTFHIESFQKKGWGRSFAGVGIGIGVIRHEQTVGDILYPLPPDTGYVLPISDTQTKLAVASNFVFMQMVSGPVGMYIAQDIDIVFLGSSTGTEVHWRENSGVAFLLHIRFGLTAMF